LPIAILGVAVGEHGLHSDFGTGLALSLIAFLAVCALEWSRSIQFETRHLHESPDFWLNQEARVRPRLFWGHAVLLSLGIGAMVVGAVRGDGVVAGAGLGCAFCGGAVVALMWGKVP